MKNDKKFTSKELEAIRGGYEISRFFDYDFFDEHDLPFATSCKKGCQSSCKRGCQPGNYKGDGGGDVGVDGTVVVKPTLPKR